MYGNSHSQGTCVLLEIPSMHELVNIFRVYIGVTIYMYLKVYILPTLKSMFVQAVLNIVVYQVLIVTECSCKQCCAIAVYAIHVDTGLHTVQCDGCEKTLCQLICLKV